MKNNQSTHSVVAIPYYGSVARPGQGFENIYIFAAVNPNTGATEDTWVESWTGRTAGELAIWLARNNVNGIFSDGYSLALEKALSGWDIWSHWEVTGEIHDIVEEHWHKHIHSAA